MTAASHTDFPSRAPLDAGESENFRVVVFGHTDDPAQFNQILIECAGVHRDDAMTAARMVPGILPMGFSQAAAQAVTERAGQEGLFAISLRETAIPRLDHAETIHHARCQPEGLELVDIHGRRTRLVLWPDLSLVSVGCVPLEDGQRFSAEPQVVLHAAPNPHRVAPEMGRREGLVLWIVCGRPGNVYRLLHNQMNYEYLGPRKVASATRNFSIFIEDLARLAPQTFLTPATRAFLHHGLRRHFEFHTADELRNYTAFHILVLRHISPAVEAARATAPACVR
ncbi:MAG TPA: hypothetical protein VMR25_03375 [Planctomycetaceae bacterium]|jgi:hypothetical protein|nr:hypothetical protein [Planctomycetaceae bacterium]